MELASLPFRSRESGGQCRPDSLASVARDALNAVEPALLEFFEEHEMRSPPRDEDLKGLEAAVKGAHGGPEAVEAAPTRYA